MIKDIESEYFDNINEEIKGEIVYGITVEYKDKTIWEFKEIKELVDKKFKEPSINKAVHEVCDSMLLKKVGHGAWELGE